MTQQGPLGSEAERQALAMLVTRFSADRDTLAAAVQRTDAAIRELTGRVDGLMPARELDALRFELGRLEALVEAAREDLARVARDVAGLQEQGPGAPTAAPTSTLPLPVVEELRAELQRMGEAAVRQAVEQAERAAARLASSGGDGQSIGGAALDTVRAQLAEALSEIQRLGAAGGEQAARTVALSADVERRGRELDALRLVIGQGRDELLRRIEEHEARLGVRLDSITVGVEAETRSLRDSLWDRLAGTDRRLDQLETQLASVRVDMPRRAAEALEGVAAMHGEMEHLRRQVGEVHDRLGVLEAPPPPGGLAGLLGCLRDEVVAATMLVVSVGAVVGRLALSLVR